MLKFRLLFLKLLTSTHGLLNTHGRPTPKPRKNNVEAEIHFNITEEREMVFTYGIVCLKV